jgi:hypothetical protein
MSGSGTSGARACGPCTRESNNRNWDCPPRMSDGRLYTDYRPRCDIQLERKASMSSSYDFRQFLIRNGVGVMNEQRSDAYKRGYCGPCMAPYDVGTMLPERDAFVCNKVACKRVAGCPNGLGTGRDYGMLPEHKAARDAFLRDQALLQAEKAQTANCCAPAPDEMGLGLNPAPQQQMARWAVPGGGRPTPTSDASVRYL